MVQLQPLFSCRSTTSQIAVKQKNKCTKSSTSFQRLKNNLLSRIFIVNGFIFVMLLVIFFGRYGIYIYSLSFFSFLSPSFPPEFCDLPAFLALPPPFSLRNPKHSSPTERIGTINSYGLYTFNSSLPQETNARQSHPINRAQMSSNK